jgi:hypothetical protein
MVVDEQGELRAGDAGTDESAEEAIVAPGVDRAREMYRRFLESDYPDALMMAEEVLRDQPDDVMALAIQTECRAAIFKPATVPAPPTNPARADSELPTSVETTPAPADPEDLTPVYVTVTRGEASREMCRRFLESDHPTALALAEELLETNPNDRMARAIAEQCRAALEQRNSAVPSTAPSFGPPSDEDTQVSASPPMTPQITPPKP